MTKLGLLIDLGQDGIIKGPNPEKYRYGSKAYEAVVLDIRNLLSFEGLERYDERRRVYMRSL